MVQALFKSNFAEVRHCVRAKTWKDSPTFKVSTKIKTEVRFKLD